MFFLSEPQSIRRSDDIILSEDDTAFAEEAKEDIGKSPKLQHYQRPRLVSESEDYTNVSYNLYAMSVSLKMVKAIPFKIVGADRKI